MSYLPQDIIHCIKLHCITSLDDHHYPNPTYYCSHKYNPICKCIVCITKKLYSVFGYFHNYRENIRILEKIGIAIKYFDNPTEEMCLTAIKQNPWSIRLLSNNILLKYPSISMYITIIRTLC